jgi:hypothetical protein
MIYYTVVLSVKKGKEERGVSGPMGDCDPQKGQGQILNRTTGEKINILFFLAGHADYCKLRRVPSSGI